MKKFLGEKKMILKIIEVKLILTGKSLMNLNLFLKNIQKLKIIMLYLIF